LKNNQDEEKEEGLLDDNNNNNKTIMATENQGRFARAVEKGVLPMIIEILKEKNTFCLFYSSTKSSLISKLIDDAIPHLRRIQNSSLTSSSDRDLQQQQQEKTIENLISTAIANCLDGVAIPILKSSSISSNSKFEKEEDDNNNNNNNNEPTTTVTVATEVSIRFASVYLVQILQRTLCNIIIYWLPLIPLVSSISKEENGIHYVFNFINDKYLQILSSVGGNNNESSSSLSAKSLFVPVWNAIHMDDRKIIDSPSLMLLTMPLRAAAHAYQLGN